MFCDQRPLKEKLSEESKPVDAQPLVSSQPGSSCDRNAATMPDKVIQTKDTNEPIESVSSTRTSTKAKTSAGAVQITETIQIANDSSSISNDKKYFKPDKKIESVKRKLDKQKYGQFLALGIPLPSSLAECNPKSKKKEPPKTLLSSFLNFIDDKVMNKPPCEPIKSDSTLNEDQEAHRRKINSANADTIPVYRNKDGDDSLTTISSGKFLTRRSSGTAPSEAQSVEEDSDGYNSATHLEHLIANLTSESITNLEDDYAIEACEDQRPQFDEQSEHSDTSRSEGRARKLFNPRLLGNDEQEYNKTRFKSIVRKIIPDQIAIPVARLLPPTRESGKVCNCGTFHYVKLYIVLTLMIGIGTNIFVEPCFNMKTFSSTKSKQSPDQLRVKQNVSESIRQTNTTISASSLKVSTHPLGAANRKNSSVNVPIKKHCVFKKIYISLMFIGLPVYLVIFLIYTCRLVVRFHKFCWFLLEATLFLVYSSFLLFFSVSSFFLVPNKKFANSLVLIDAVFGLFIAFWAYRKHTLGTDPFSLISIADRDMYEITQILAHRQITKLFTLGTAPQQDNNKQNVSLGASESATFVLKSGLVLQ